MSNTYSTISFYDEEMNECLEVLYCDHRLYGNIDGEDLSPNELVNCINSLSEIDKVRLIRECGGAKKFRHAYRKLFYENPVKILDRDLKELNSSSLEDYLELSYKAGLNPLPALRARGIKVKFSGENLNPHFTDEDIIVCLNDGFVTVLFNPWNRDTATRIVNKDLKFRLDQAADIKKNREFRLKNRIIRKKIIKYSEID